MHVYYDSKLGDQKPTVASHCSQRNPATSLDGNPGKDS